MRRRKFIGGLAAALCAPSISKAVQSDKIKIGQIGLAHPHARGKLAAIRSLAEEYEFVGVVEPDEARRKSVRGVKFISEEELLNTKGLQAVAIETRVRDLVPTAARVVGTGRHIHLDKPAGPSLPAFKKLVAEAKARNVGNGMQEGVTMGPAVCASELEGNLDYIKIAQEEGAELCWGGDRLGEGDLEHGHFMSPAVIGNVKNDSRIAQEEVFGPVIGVVKSGDFDEAIALANDIEYGLSASIITRDINKAMRYTDQIEAGVVKINQISTGLALQVPFGGVKHSSSNNFKEQGQTAIDFYSQVKSVYLDYSA